MSGNRANAAAVQRRTVNAQNNVAPPGGSRQVQGQQQNQNMRQQPGRQQQQQQQVQQQPMQNPKMSVSDAIGLLSLRLGRMETFVQQLPPLDQIGTSGGVGSAEVGENMRIVDEAVFTNIVSRLDNLEKTRNVAPLPNPQQNKHNVANNEKLAVLTATIESLTSEIKTIKDMVLNVQSFAIDTNQKMLNYTQKANVAESAQTVEEVADDTEILVENIDLKSFVESASI